MIQYNGGHIFNCTRALFLNILCISYFLVYLFYQCIQQCKIDKSILYFYSQVPKTENPSTDDNDRCLFRLMNAIGKHKRNSDLLKTVSEQAYCNSNDSNNKLGLVKASVLNIPTIKDEGMEYNAHRLTKNLIDI